MLALENAEEVLQVLERFTKQKSKDIPPELEEYLSYVAKTGDTVYRWPDIQYLFREKLISVIKEFHDTTASIEDLPQCPNVDQFNYESMKSTLLERLELFHAAPFTVQRLCELLTDPKKHYTRLDKFMRALEKNILVVSTVEPGRKRVAQSDENGDGSALNGDIFGDINIDMECKQDILKLAEASNADIDVVATKESDVPEVQATSSIAVEAEQGIGSVAIAADVSTAPKTDVPVEFTVETDEHIDIEKIAKIDEPVATDEKDSKLEVGAVESCGDAEMSAEILKEGEVEKTIEKASNEEPVVNVPVVEVAVTTPTVDSADAVKEVTTAKVAEEAAPAESDAKTVEIGDSAIAAADETSKPESKKTSSNEFEIKEKAEESVSEKSANSADDGKPTVLKHRRPDDEEDAAEEETNTKKLRLDNENDKPEENVGIDKVEVVDENVIDSTVVKATSEPVEEPSPSVADVAVELIEEAPAIVEAKSVEPAECVVPEKIAEVPKVSENVAATTIESVKTKLIATEPAAAEATPIAEAIPSDSIDPTPIVVPTAQESMAVEDAESTPTNPVSNDGETAMEAAPINDDQMEVDESNSVDAMDL